MEINQLTEQIIGSAIEVHRVLGPGLLESAYEECLAMEMSIRNLLYERQKPLPLQYKGHKLDCGYRLDFLVAGAVVLELKAVDQLLPIHHAQVITYLRTGHFKVGLLINFHSSILKQGTKRIVLGYDGLKPSFSAHSASPR